MDGEARLESKVLAFVKEEGLLAPGERVVIGVSGGPDSLCLLHLLVRAAPELGVEVHAAHLNHLIRGPAADADAQFVANLAASWGVPCTVEAYDVPALARERKLAMEEAARQARYAFLAQVAQRIGARRIAVAHNADDQSETVLMHWLRGAGLAGLRGMLPATRMSDLRLSVSAEEVEGVWLIRPLLEVPRVEIERYCREHGLTPRFDRSNLDTTLYRNKLRHELLPYLEREYKPRFREILRRSARVIRDDYDLLCSLRDRAWAQVVRAESEQAVTFDLAAWRQLHPALQRATLRRAVERLRRNLRDVSFVHVEAAMRVGLRGGVGARVTLPRGLMLIVGYDTLSVADADMVQPPDFAALSVERAALTVPGLTKLPDGLRVETQLLAVGELPPDWEHNQDPWRAFLDADVVGERPALRRRRPGDRFCPLGMGGRHKRLSEFLINARVPARWRDAVPLLVRYDDEIMWVCGWRVDERARVRQDTTRVLAVRLWHDDHDQEGA